MKAVRKLKKAAPKETSAGSGQVSPPDGGYETGYKRPPRASQFRPGQTGNPNGRPRKPKPSPDPLLDGVSQLDLRADAFLREALRKIPIQENGKTALRSAGELATRAMFNKAIKGDSVAQREVHRELERRRKALAAKKKEEYDLAFDRKVELTIFLLRAERRGLKPPDLPLHPDDIIIAKDGSVHIATAPKTKEEKARAGQTTKLWEMRQDWVEELALAKEDLRRDPEYRASIQRTIRVAKERLKIFERIFPDGAIEIMPGVEETVRKAAEISLAKSD